MKTSILVLVCVLACGCGDDGGDMSSGIDAGSGNPLVQSFTCNAGNSNIPTADKSCTVVDDCAVAIHQIDCCGNAIAVGINAADLDEFNAAEGQCATMFPACGCPSGPYETEDGLTALGDVMLECDAGRCVTTGSTNP